ncbi:hypothetical protein [uncultured Modestobacter sp.]|uniref:hypothetical protein n=1 Tax=uncultured Modestobacter sp. TaxID=380048 RepID=UPI00263695DA|nr:hypothetical protein [uncultured Modestobacter sp.]
MTGDPRDVDGPVADRDQAAAQLAGLQSDRAAMADRAMQPWWYDALLGLLVFGLFAVLATDNPFLVIGAVVLFSLGLRGLMATYQRLTGFWVNGLRPGPTQKAIRVWFVLYALSVGPALVLALGFDVRWPLVVVGALMGLSIALISRWWSRIYIAELRGEL